MTATKKPTTRREKPVGGLWDQPDVPHKGWTCINIEDLGEPAHTCEMCRWAECRYVHYMRHPDYPKVLGVGCICAGNMEADYERARQRERNLINRSKRRSNWLSRTWRKSLRGNEYINTDRFNIVVYPKGKGWTFRLKRGNTWESTKTFPTIEEAKLAAFDALMDLKQKAG